jgi:hypothetical protein
MIYFSGYGKGEKSMSDERTIKPNKPANFTPQLGDYKTLQPFRYWCQKVLPLVYDDSLSYYELLCKVVDYLNKTMEDVETLHGDVTNLHTAYVELQGYVNNYFASLDVQQEINNKLDQMAISGELTNLLEPFFTNLQNNISNLISRMNEFSKLQDGSTTGDAELIDGRISWTGSSYENIGENIRNTTNDINKIMGSVAFPENFLEKTYTGTLARDFFITVLSTNEAYSDYIKISDLVSTEYLYQLVGLLKTDSTAFNTEYNGRVYYYDKNKELLTWYAISSVSYENNIIRKAKYVRFWINSVNLINFNPSARISELSVGSNLKSYVPNVIKAKYSKILNRVLSNTNFKVINRLGYRGYGGNENSIYAFKQAILHGYKLILADLIYTADGVGVCLHDTTINRTARNLDGSTISQTINIGDITYEQTKQFDFGIAGGISQMGATKIEDVINLCKYSNAKLYIEYKGGSFSNYDSFFKLVKKYGMYNNIVFTGGTVILNYVANKYPNLEIGLITNNLEKDIDFLVNIPAKRKFYFGFNDEILSENIRNIMFENNIELECGTINTVDELKKFFNSDTGKMCTAIESDILFGGDVIANYPVDNELTNVNTIKNFNK